MVYKEKVLKVKQSSSVNNQTIKYIFEQDRNTENLLNRASLTTKLYEQKFWSAPTKHDKILQIKNKQIQTKKLLIIAEGVTN